MGNKPNARAGHRLALITLLLVVLVATLTVLPGCGRGGKGSDSGDDMGISRVPNVVGMTEDEATEAIEDVGLEVGDVTHEYDDEAEAGTVTSQSPKANTKQEEGTEIDLVISDGPTPASTVEVPCLSHMTPAQAEAALAKVGLKGRRGEDVAASEELGAEVKPGHVATQDPGPLTQAAPGSTVTYHLVEMKDEVEVPNVVGMSKGDASSTLEAAGFVVNVSYKYSDSVGEGKVISQSPSAGSSAEKGSTVTIVVSEGPGPSSSSTVTVPDIQYLSYDDAVYNVADRGLNYTIEYAYSDDVAYGYAIGTSPSAGSEVAPGSTVTIIISEGTGSGGVSTVSVPGVVNNDVTDAYNNIVAAGLNCNVVWVADVAPYGYVFDCYPPMGTEVEAGSTVDIYVSDGSGYDGAGS